MRASISASQTILIWKTKHGPQSEIDLAQDGRQFLGTFDGNDRTVSGLYVEKAYGSVGLFGFVGMSSRNTTAEVKNLNVVGSVSVERTPATFYVAGIAGFVGQGAEITNCSFEGTITATITSGQGKIRQFSSEESLDIIIMVPSASAQFRTAPFPEPMNPLKQTTMSTWLVLRQTIQ